MIAENNGDGGRRKLHFTVFLSSEQRRALRFLSAATRVPMSIYIREGIDMVIHAHPLRQVNKEG